MGFFDFLTGNPRYAGHDLNLNRLNRRHEMLVTPYAGDLAGSRVLDLASHDGRWSYALSAAGAREVVGVEARGDQIEQYAAYPDGEVKDRVSFVHGDVYDVLPELAQRGESFDVVAIFGLYYHVMDHYGLLELVHRLRPRLVVIDSEFARSADPVIRLATETTDSHLNSISHTAGQAVAPVGVPSRSAMELMARTLGYAVEWSDWGSVARHRRGGLKAYYRGGGAWKRRATCALRPA